jgi:Uma2 family endonuclease
MIRVSLLVVVMINIDLIDLQRLPSSLELPDSDDTPVDNEDQNLLPNILLFLLQSIWDERTDWFFGVDMGIYHDVEKPRVPIVPDGFLALGVERHKNNDSRRSYVLWEEQWVMPILALEMVSWTPGGEYQEKMAIYQKLGVLYYVIYNPRFWRRDGHQPLEIYRLVNGQYQIQSGEPFWLPEIGLGIGRCQIALGTVEKEMLSWFNDRGDRYLQPKEQAQIAQEQARIEREERLAAEEQARVERAERLAAEEQARIERLAAEKQVETLLQRLRELGEDI